MDFTDDFCDFLTAKLDKLFLCLSVEEIDKCTVALEGFPNKNARAKIDVIGTAVKAFSIGAFHHQSVKDIRPEVPIKVSYTLKTDGVYSKFVHCFDPIKNKYYLRAEVPNATEIPNASDSDCFYLKVRIFFRSLHFETFYNIIELHMEEVSSKYKQLPLYFRVYFLNLENTRNSQSGTSIVLENSQNFNQISNCFENSVNQNSNFVENSQNQNSNFVENSQSSQSIFNSQQVFSQMSFCSDYEKLPSNSQITEFAETTQMGNGLNCLSKGIGLKRETSKCEDAKQAKTIGKTEEALIAGFYHMFDCYPKSLFKKTAFDILGVDNETDAIKQICDLTKSY